jgi:putative MATE family efflux protein
VPSDNAQMMMIAKEYFTLLCFSFIPFAISAVLISVLRSVEAVSVALFSSGISLILTIFLNYTFMFGNFGFPAMGVRGMALATIISRTVELMIVLIYTFRFQKQISIRLKDLVIRERWLWLDFAKYSLPVGLVDTQWALVGFFKAIFVRHMGETFIAANTITVDFINLSMVFTFALASGACVIVGKTVGSGNYEKLRQYSKSIQILFACLGFFMSGVIIALRVPFITLYGVVDFDVINIARTLIVVGALTTIGTSYHAACFVGINRGAGDNRFVLMVDIICGWLIVLPLCFLSVFVFRWPPVIFFLCTRIDQCFKWIIAFIRLRGDKWIRNVTRDE